MKVLVICSAIMAVVACNPQLRRTNSARTSPEVKTWTIKELFNVLQNKICPELEPYLEDGAHQFMLALFLNINWKNLLASITSPSGNKTWNKKELKDEHHSSVPHSSSSELKEEYHRTGLEDIPDAIGAIDISIWDIDDVEEAMANPDTRIELMPYLEKALEELELKNNPTATVTLVTPVGLLTNNSELLEYTTASSSEEQSYSYSEEDESEILTTTSRALSREKAIRSRPSESDIPHGVFLKIFALNGRKNISSVIKAF